MSLVVVLPCCRAVKKSSTDQESDNTGTGTVASSEVVIITEGGAYHFNEYNVTINWPNDQDPVEIQLHSCEELDLAATAGFATSVSRLFHICVKITRPDSDTLIRQLPHTYELTLAIDTDPATLVGKIILTADAEQNTQTQLWQRVGALRYFLTDLNFSQSTSGKFEATMIMTGSQAISFYGSTEEAILPPDDSTEIDPDQPIISAGGAPGDENDGDIVISFTPNPTLDTTGLQLVIKGQKGSDAPAAVDDGETVYSGPFASEINWESTGPGIFHSFRLWLNDSESTNLQVLTIESVRSRGHLLFITSTFYNGNLGGLTGADAKCQEHADASAIFKEAGAEGAGGPWVAILGDSQKNANTRIVGSTEAGVYRMSMAPNSEVFQPLAADVAALWQTTSLNLLSYPNITENRTIVSSNLAWTGASADGGPQSMGFYCEDWTTSEFMPRGGNGAANKADPTYIAGSPANCNNSLHLYCISQ